MQGRMHRHLARGRRLAALALLAWAAAGAAAEADAFPAPEVVTLRTRGEVRQAYLLLAVPAPQAVALLFPGGDGVVDLERLRTTPPGERGNFLVRSRELLRSPELAVAVLDAPSDRHEHGMDDGFRAGADHRADVAAVVADLRARFPGARLYLVGTSRGTVSAAHLAASLGGEIDGVVLSSTVLRATRGGSGLDGFDLGSVHVPLLLVHHAADACPACPYDRALALSRHHPLVTVRGGTPDASDPCGPLSAHGYHGREAGTAAAIRSFLLGRPVPETVGP
jgi:hypothetical protein